CMLIDKAASGKSNRCQYTIVRKLRFILGRVIFLDLGKLCSQFVCVASFITSKLPCSSTSEMVSFVCLCLNENFRSAPKLNEAMVLFLPKDFSSSLCQAIPSSPFWYKFSKHELKSVCVRPSTICLRSESSSVHGNARFVVFE